MFESDVPRFKGKNNEKFVERVTEVRLPEAQHKKPRIWPRLHRRGLLLLGKLKQNIKTLLGQGDRANFTVENIIETLRLNGYRDTVEEKCQEALDN